MDLRTFYQAQLFAPAFLFQSTIEFWGQLIEPRSRPVTAPEFGAPRLVDPAPAEIRPAAAEEIRVGSPVADAMREAA